MSYVAPPPAPSPSRYALGELLYEDTHASIYRAVRCADQRPILLKVLAPDHVRARDLARLTHDYEIGRALADVAVVAPLGLTTFDGRPALELAAFAGEPLERRVGAPMPLDALLPIAVRLAAVVAEVHERGVVHKDVKPANVWHDRATGEVALGSFELATRSTGAPTAPDPVRALVGSLPYMSPEQTGRMNRAVDSRSDLYSLGVTLYQLATGRLPYEAHDAIAWVHCHVAVTPPRADEVTRGSRARSPISSASCWRRCRTIGTRARRGCAAISSGACRRGSSRGGSTRSPWASTTSAIGS